MKKFLLKITLFFFPFFVYFVLIPIMVVAIRSSRISLKLPKDKTILFVGDSHIGRGVNEKFIPGALNWSAPMENYLNLFARTRKLLEANPQISTVFVVATPWILRRDADERIFAGNAGNNGDVEILVGRSIIFYEPGDLKYCEETIANALKNPGPQRKALLEAISKKTFGTLREFGGFEDTGESSEAFWKEIENNGELGKKRLRMEAGEKEMENRKDYGNVLTVKYLRKIVEFARARGVRVVFLNPPLYRAEEFYDVSYFETTLKENFPDVEFWDYGNFPVPENCFQNINHLNGKGAEIFSKELARRIRDEGLTSPSST